MDIKLTEEKEQLNLYGVVKRTLILGRVNLHLQKINLPISYNIFIKIIVIKK